MGLRETKLQESAGAALYSSPDIIKNLKSRRLSWAGHVARMELSRNAYRIVGKPEESMGGSPGDVSENL